MATTMKIKECFPKLSSRHTYHLSGSLAVISMVLITFKIITKIHIHRSHHYSTNELNTTIDQLNLLDYSLFLFLQKGVESLFVLFAWLSALKSSWRKVTATGFFLGFNFSVLGFLLISVYGTCFMVACPQAKPTLGCPNSVYFKPSTFLPPYFLFHIFTAAMLFICTKSSNDEVFLMAENSNAPNHKQFLYIWFCQISTGYQAAALFFACSCIQIVSCLWSIVWYIVWFINGIYVAYKIAFVSLGLLSKVVLVIVTGYGLKRQNSAFLIASLIICALSILLATILQVIFLAEEDSLYRGQFHINLKHPTSICHLGYALVLTYCMEALSFRCLLLCYKQCRKSLYPIPFNERLLRIADSKIKCEQLLGQGQFGEVWFGKISLNHATTSAAVKRLKPSATDEMRCWFFEEAILLSRFDHENIIKPIGLCMDSKPVLLCMEYLDGGSLSDYLLREEARKMLSPTDLLEVILQVAKACCYLESEGYIHRDIAARNCLVSCKGLSDRKPKVVKLSDFGLAKDVRSRYKNTYKLGEHAIIPVPYTAPEGLGGSFGLKSDVWSFGVLAWEVFSWCARPFGKCQASTTIEHRCLLNEYTLEQIETMVQRDHKTLLDIPDPCTATFSDSLRLFLAICWKFNVDERPNFQRIKAIIESLKKNSTCNLPCFPSAKVEELNKPATDELQRHALVFSSILTAPSSTSGSSDYMFLEMKYI